MHVVPPHQRRPLRPDKRGEISRIVVAVRRIDRLLPRCLVGSAVGCIHQALRKFSLGELSNQLERHVDSLSRLNTVVPVTTGRVTEDVRIAGKHIGEEPHVVGVVRNHQKVERSRQFYR